MSPIIDDSSPSDDLMPMTSRYQTERGSDFQVTTWRNHDRSWSILVVGPTNTEIGGDMSLSRHHSRKDAFGVGERYIDEHCG